MLTIHWNIRDATNIARKEAQEKGPSPYRFMSGIQAGLRYYQPADYDIVLTIGKDQLAIPYEVAYPALLYKNLKAVAEQMHTQRIPDGCMTFTCSYGYDLPFEYLYFGVDYAHRTVAVWREDGPERTVVPLAEAVEAIADFIEASMQLVVEHFPQQFGVAETPVPYFDPVYKAEQERLGNSLADQEADYDYFVGEARIDWEDTQQWLKEVRAWSQGW